MPFLSREEENKVEARLAAVVFEKLGVDAGSVKVAYRGEKSILFYVNPIKLNPALFGPIAPMFKTATVKVDASIGDRDKNLLYFNFNYDYTLPDGGHNGYTHRFEEDIDFGS